MYNVTYAVNVLHHYL